MSKEWGKKVSGCNFCIHADKENMKCFPNSKDCAYEYDLKEEDFKKECFCDFYHKK